MALPASDTFLQSSGSSQALATYNASWTVQVGTFTVQSGTGYVSSSSSGVDYQMAFWNADSFNAKQFAKVQFATGWAAAGRPYCGPAVRCSNTGGGAGYGVEIGGTGEYYIGRIVGGTGTTVKDHTTGGSATWADGDWARLTVETIDASTVRVTLERATAAAPDTWIAVTTFDDTNASRPLSGAGGVVAFDATSNAMIGYWEADNVPVAAVPSGGILTSIGL